jgi:Ca2+-binding EF-hand superfamily protein
MVESLGDLKTNSLSLAQFSELLDSDWSIGVSNLGESAFEVVFTKESLGFSISLDKANGRIKVNNVSDPIQKGVLAAGDLIIAINGAPLGNVTHPKILQDKIKPLKKNRPLRITFLRDLKLQSTVTAHSTVKLETIFKRFDYDGSGTLDSFELSDAVEAAWSGIIPTTAQITAMVESVGAHETNTLTYEQFAEVLSNDWPVESDHGGSFELTFSKESLGFAIQFDELGGRIEVNSVADPDLKGELAAGDIIIAVNGAPLGFVKHPKALKEKVGPMKRPLRITFMRLMAKEAARLDETDENLAIASVNKARSVREAEIANAVASAASAPTTSTVMAKTPSEVEAIFTSFDTDGSGDLDTFELLNAIQAVWGQAPTTAQIMAIIETLGVYDTGQISLQQFSDVLATDWSGITTVDGIEDAYEVMIEKDLLGFDVSFDEVNGRLAVKAVSDPEISAQVDVNDAILAVNGAPLGYVSDPVAVEKKIKGAQRPVRITFYRREALDKMSNEVSNRVSESRLAQDVQLVFAAAAETAAQSTVTAHHLSEIEAIFKRFDWDESGSLDSFELSSAVEAAWGRPPTMAQVLAMISATSSADFSLSLQQFADVLATDWSGVLQNEHSVDVAYDVSF